MYWIEVQRVRGCLNRASDLALLAMVSLCVSDCASEPKAPPKPPTAMVFRLTHHLGGTHYRTAVDRTYCYQTFDSSLVVTSAGEVQPLKTIELGKTGETGPAIDMVLHESTAGKRLWIVIEDDELLELSLDLPQAPAIINRFNAMRLGIRPRRLSIVENDLYVSGPGGVIRVRDGAKMYSTDADVSRIAIGEAGLVACVERQALRLSDGKYVGSATDFAQPTPEHLVFIRQSEHGGLVGLMNSQMREVDTQRATVAVLGSINSVRVFHGRLWITSDQMIVGYRIEDRALADPLYVDILGGTDIAPVNENLFAISGTFGRATYRTQGKDGTEAPGFVKIQREPSRLSMAVSDGRHILAGGSEGLWMYLINSRVDLTTRQYESAPPPPQTSASVATGTAKISDDRRTIKVTSNVINPATGEKESFAIGEEVAGTNVPCLLHCVHAVDGDFWIGHDRGITVIKAPLAPIDPDASKKEQKAAKLAAKQASTNRIAGRIRIDGPVLYIYPLLVGGGASFVSEFGGFGVAKFVEEPISSSTENPRG